MIVSEIALAASAALIAGFVDAIAGAGGVINFPVLIFMGLPMDKLIGTNKFASAFGTITAAITYWRRGFVNREIVSIAAPLTAVASLLGAYLVLHLPNEFLKPLVSSLTLLIALYAFFRPNFGTRNSYDGMHGAVKRKVLIGALLIGIYDGFFGPGTGMFLSFLFVGVAQLDFVRAAGNTKVLNSVSNIFPLCYFITQGAVRYDLAIAMAIANIIGGYIGARSAVRVGPRLVRWIFILMASALTAKLVHDYFW